MVTSAEYRKLLSTKKSTNTRRGKYNNKVTQHKDGRFDSKKELKRWLELKSKQADGYISDLRRQVPYSLDIGQHHICDYIADHVYIENGSEVIEDCKGVLTPEYRLKKKMMLAIHGIAIKEV